MAKKNRCATKDGCISCRKMGALSKGYAFVELEGGYQYPLCHKCVRDCCGVGRPERGETYQLLTPFSLGVGGTFYTQKPIKMAIYPGVPHEEAKETTP